MLQSIFNTLASGSQQGGGQQAGGDVLSSVLGSLMGGGGQVPAAPQANQAQSLENEVGSLLGGLMGGGTATPMAQPQSTGNPLLDLVGSGTNPMLNGLIQPLVDQIAVKLGIPPALAMTAVTFAIHYMITQHGTKLVNGEDMGSILEKHGDTNHLNTQGISQQFAKQAHIPPAQAANTLSEVFKLLQNAVPGLK